VLFRCDIMLAQLCFRIRLFAKFPLIAQLILLCSLVFFSLWVSHHEPHNTQHTGTGSSLDQRKIYDRIRWINYNVGTYSYKFWMEASRCAYKRNMILYSVRQHNHFITQGNYKATCFDYRLVILRLIFVNLVTRCYAHFGIPSCLHPWNTSN